MTTTRTPARLVLEDGTMFTGDAYGARGQTLGEAVFDTAMTGYQETLTDPSYAGQIVIKTAPHIGNTGWNEQDHESRRIWVEGFVVRDPARRTSSWRATGDLVGALEAGAVVGISGIDTRALTLRLREGAQRAGIFSGDALVDDAGRPVADHELVARVRSAPGMVGASFVDAVTTAEPYVVPAVGTTRGRVVCLDLGVKDSSPRRLAERGLDVHVLPAGSTRDEIRAREPGGIFFSNGPGDPATADHQVEILRGALDDRIPFFGICLGNQLLGRALGFGTYKLPFGHHGTNQPVQDRASGRVEITAHNHGFAVDVPLDGPTAAPFGSGRYGRVEVSHVGLNDDVVEGLACLDRPAFSVQFHPEACAGPHDADHLFDRFAALVADSSADSEGGRA